MIKNADDALTGLHDVNARLIRKFEALLELVDQAIDGGSVVIPTALIIQALETK